MRGAGGCDHALFIVIGAAVALQCVPTLIVDCDTINLIVNLKKFIPITLVSSSTSDSAHHNLSTKPSCIEIIFKQKSQYKIPRPNY